MSDFEILKSWLPRPGNSEADATLARLHINVADKCISDFKDSREIDGSLEIPAYYLAEWIAENWWPLLWEPKKVEGVETDGDYVRRHSFLAAQHGFALPNVEIVPLGKLIEISARARESELARVRFTEKATVITDRSNVENELRKFVDSVVSRLSEANIRETFLQSAWSLVSATDDDEELFCRLSGALGVSPYEIDEHFANRFEQLEASIGSKLLLELCQAATPDSFEGMARITEQAVSLTTNAAVSTLSPLDRFILPSDNLNAPAHRFGVQAANLLRKKLGISDTDIRGATKIFDKLHVDPSRQIIQRVTDFDEISVTGAVVRHDKEMKIGLLQATETKRRFSAARAILSALTADDNESTLLTSADTRDQQANRAFAAEITCPYAIVKSRAKHNRISSSTISDLAAELHIGQDVVRKRAVDNGLLVSGARLN
jgi:hypothetical protein